MPNTIVQLGDSLPPRTFVDNGDGTFAEKIALSGSVQSNPAAGAIVALSSPPATLTANADTALPFVQPVRHPRVQNNSTTTKWIAFDTPATNGSLVAVAPGLLFSDDITVTALHIWSSDAVAVNGANGVAVWGFS